MGTRFWPILALLLVSAFWGGHAVVGKAVEHQLNALQLTVWRFTLSAMCYTPLFPRLRAIFRLPRRTFWLLALTGLCWAELYPLLYYQSLRSITPVESLLLVNTSPFLAALLAWVLFRERISSRQWIGIIVSFTGVILIGASGWTGKSAIVGVVLALVAAGAFACYTVLSRRLFQQLPLFDVLIATSVWGAVFAWIVAAVGGKLRTVAFALTQLNQSGWEEFLYIVLIVSTVAYAFYAYGLKRLPAAISSAVTFYPQAIFAALIQWLWLGLAPSGVVVLSAGLILGGTAVMNWPNSKDTARRKGMQPERVDMN